MMQAQTVVNNVSGTALYEAARSGIDGDDDFVEMDPRMLLPDLEYVGHSPAQLRFLQHVKKGLPDSSREANVVTAILQECP